MKKLAAILILLFLAVAIPDLYFRGHPYFVTGLNPYVGTVFLVIGIMITIPLVIFFSRWLARLVGGAAFFSPALLFAIAAISFWILGVLEKSYFDNSTLDIHLNYTYFVLKGFSSIILPLMFAVFSIAYFCLEKFTGNRPNRILSYLHFGLTFIIMHLLFIPQYLGIGIGMPRRYVDYQAFGSFDHFNYHEIMINTYILILLIAQLLFFINLFITLIKKRQLSI